MLMKTTANRKKEDTNGLRDRHNDDRLRQRSCEISKPSSEAEAARACRTGVTQRKSIAHILHRAYRELFIYTLFVFKTVQISRLSLDL